MLSFQNILQHHKYCVHSKLIIFQTFIYVIQIWKTDWIYTPLPCDRPTSILQVFLFLFLFIFHLLLSKSLLHIHNAVSAYVQQPCTVHIKKVYCKLFIHALNPLSGQYTESAAAAAALKKIEPIPCSNCVCE